MSQTRIQKYPIYYRGGVFQIEKCRLFNIFIYKNFGRIKDIKYKVLDDNTENLFYK